MDYYNNKNSQTIVHSGAKYRNTTMKCLQGLVWRASKMKRFNLAVLIEDNTSSDLVEEWYNEAVIEAAKMKKEFEIDTNENST